MTPARSLEDAVPVGASVLIDTSVVLAYLTGTEPISPLATELFDGFLASGRNLGALSMITVTDLLVRPFRSGAASVAIIEGFVGHFGNLQLLPVDYATGREAARIRAATGLSTPDSLIAASFLIGNFDVLVTNDASWPGRLDDVVVDRPVIVMRDLS